MESDLLAGMQGGAKGERLQSLSVAVNADSLSSWFLPGVVARCCTATACCWMWWWTTRTTPMTRSKAVM
jgi:hypothetical protein